LSSIGVVVAALTWLSVSVRSTEEGESDAGEDIAARDAYRHLQLQDENGEIPPNGLIDAYKQKEGMQFLPEAWYEFTPGSGTGLADGSQPGVLQDSDPGVLRSDEMAQTSGPNPWVSIGPGNIGGRIRSIIIHPTANPRTIWIGAVSGGVWKTTDGGESWSTNTDFLANLGVHCMAIDPANPEILYAGTGETFRGNGIFKTDNGGATWSD
jgi:photosystem II stability/assembly factor-like uncharacterized protein